MHVLLTSDQIRDRVEEMGREILADHASDEAIHLVCVLKGGFMFLSDLVRVLKAHVTLDFVAVSSYGTQTRPSGEVRLTKDVDHGVKDRHVILVEGVVDTGQTLHYLQELFRARSPKSLRTACLLSKPSRRETDVRVEYVGFAIDDHFVVGYGLDFDERYRGLPDIAVLAD